jgi:hypothetical protein
LEKRKVADHYKYIPEREGSGRERIDGQCQIDVALVGSVSIGSKKHKYALSTSFMEVALYIDDPNYIRMSK